MGLEGGLGMDVVEHMKKRQAEINEALSQLPEEREVEPVQFVEKEMPSHTNILYYDDKVLLTRYLYGKIYKVEFVATVMVKDILPYLDLVDGRFIRCAVRPAILD